MTQIITAVTKNSILMASDTRLNYHEEVKEGVNVFQVIKATADCIRKTFYLKRSRMGIQFLGIGYFPVGSFKYPIAHFIPMIEEGIRGRQGIKLKFKIIFANLKKITTEGDTGKYVNGVISGMENNDMYIATFNTFNHTEGNLEIKKVKQGDFVDSEEILKNIYDKENLVVDQICAAIASGSERKPYYIGDEVEILKITKKNAVYLQEGKKLFYGNNQELFKLFQENPSRINGQILTLPVKQKVEL